MTAPFSHSGGAIVTDHGPLSLDEAGSLASFYAAEARCSALVGAAAWARRCTDRAAALNGAVAAASLWRRAAGWREPRDADQARLGV